jgi:hypothetical protein
MRFVACVDLGWQAKDCRLARVALFPFRLSSGKPALVPAVAGGSDLNFLRKIQHFRMAINGIANLGVL